MGGIHSGIPSVLIWHVPDVGIDDLIGCEVGMLEVGMAATS
jgi:hypothetical protein